MIDLIPIVVTTDANPASESTAQGVIWTSPTEGADGGGQFLAALFAHHGTQTVADMAMPTFAAGTRPINPYPIPPRLSLGHVSRCVSRRCRGRIRGRLGLRWPPLASQ